MRNEKVTPLTEPYWVNTKGTPRKTTEMIFENFSPDITSLIE